jgi:hypothetical protein
MLLGRLGLTLKTVVMLGFLLLSLVTGAVVFEYGSG